MANHTSKNTVETGLEAFRHQNRVLLVFAPSPDDPRCVAQKRLLFGASEGLGGRDLRVLYFFEQVLEHPEDERFTAGAAKVLRERFRVTERFTTLLIGKDGTEKARTREPVHPEDLFRTVDQMPMRQREMRG